jgi:4-hydroxybenzoate polyprenyltransferase
MAVRAPQAGVSFARAAFDLSRGRQALLSVAQPGLGALLALGALPSPAVIGLGLVAAASGFLAVFSLNDVLDRHVDEQALGAGKAQAAGFDMDTVFLRHPLAVGTMSFPAAVAWVGGLGLVSAVSAWILSPACLALFVTAVLLEVLYCALRRVTWAKTFVSGLMVAAGGLAGWVAVARLSWAAASFFAFLVVWEIAGRNISNDLADIRPDRAVGIRTVATVFGEDAATRGILVGSIAAPMTLLALPVSLPARVACAAVGVWAMTAPAIGLAEAPSSSGGAAYFNRASLLPAIAFVVVLISVVVVT